jgi:hypothetical protein
VKPRKEEEEEEGGDAKNAPESQLFAFSINSCNRNVYTYCTSMEGR